MKDHPMYIFLHLQDQFLVTFYKCLTCVQTQQEVPREASEMARLPTYSVK